MRSALIATVTAAGLLQMPAAASAERAAPVPGATGTLAPIIPPVPQPARRPQRADAAEPLDAPIIPPVPQPARRPTPTTIAASPPVTDAIVPPVPQLVRRPLQVAALASVHAEPPARPPLQPGHGLRRDPKAEQQLACLRTPVRRLLERIEAEFGPMQIISTCRPGARIAGSGRMSKHASGEAIDFDAGGRKREVVQWLIANHHDGGTMTYADMSHVHVDIGPHFVALNAYSGR